MWRHARYASRGSEAFDPSLPLPEFPLSMLLRDSAKQCLRTSVRAASSRPRHTSLGTATGSPCRCAWRRHRLILAWAAHDSIRLWICRSCTIRRLHFRWPRWSASRAGIKAGRAGDSRKLPSRAWLSPLQRCWSRYSFRCEATPKSMFPRSPRRRSVSRCSSRRHPTMHHRPRIALAQSWLPIRLQPQCPR